MLLMIGQLAEAGRRNLDRYCEIRKPDYSKLFLLEDPWGYLDKNLKCNFPDIDECFEMEQFFDYKPQYRRYEHLTYYLPLNVDATTDIDLVRGKTHQITARSVVPPIYEVEDFLTDEECDYIIERAKAEGMAQSGVFGEDINIELQSKPPEEVSRISDQAWLYLHEDDKVINSIMDRITKLTKMPRKYIDDSEAIQVVNYGVGGHYHAHMDTTRPEFDDDKDYRALPCCYQTKCEIDLNLGSCCKNCRYITVLFYLNDVEEGGETAFPFADFRQRDVDDLRKGKIDYLNLSKYCKKVHIKVKPKKGKAIMWYNHEKDSHNGLLGPVIDQAFHGGCDVKKGTKWIANFWISAPPFEHRNKPSVFNIKNN
ncbi:hypothetical protein ScPMuIL_001035 [Solemya velum]